MYPSDLSLEKLTKCIEVKQWKVWGNLINDLFNKKWVIMNFTLKIKMIKKDNLIILALLFRNEGHGGRAFKRVDTISTSNVELLFSIKQNN